MNVVYCITSPSKKKYIGQSNNIKKRLKDHKRNAKYFNYAIHNAINKYGWKNMEVEILQENISDDNINGVEIVWIAWYNTYLGKGYNMTMGGKAPMKGRKLSKSHKEKISKATKGRICTWGNKISKSNMGRVPSRATRELWSKQRKGKRVGEDSPFAKLTFDAAKEIRKLYSGGQYSQRKLAKKFGVGQSTIWRVLNNKLWTAKGDNI